MLAVNGDKCVGCGLCVSFCPTEALKAWGLCRVDADKCNECLVCLDYCPVDALAIQEGARQ
ncbi:MAG TPA: 4Fe-4S binding protein [Dehalococcoidia bacterium]|jgi:NAD-dependent dihydropyrimidine dehydrogenase PreA subunit|nr:4Fe-4S binding protein [Dehalococcoidia bacterium]